MFCQPLCRLAAPAASSPGIGPPGAGRRCNAASAGCVSIPESDPVTRRGAAFLEGMSNVADTVPMPKAAQATRDGALVSPGICGMAERDVKITDDAGFVVRKSE